MTKLQNTFLGLSTAFLLSSCSVQHFPVNTKVQPFEYGGKFWGEKTEKCGENGWKLNFMKDKDIHLIGVSIRNSNTNKMAEALNASSYTIETKSNLIVRFISFGIMDFKSVKVIKREN